MKRNSIFNSIPLLKPKRNTFNLSFENKLSTDLFRLTPIMCKEALPDDVVKIRPEIFCRVSPMLSPIFHRLNIRTYYFFVPTRIIWNEFEKWINPKSGTSEIVPPKLTVENSSESGIIFGNFAPKTLADYLGVNFGLNAEDQSNLITFTTKMATLFPMGFTISSLPFRAYQQIYNDWFIDLNNVDPADFSKDSGVEVLGADDDADLALESALLKLRYRCWEHDYFTSALPEPQRGPDVNAFDGGEGSGEYTPPTVDVAISGKEGVIYNAPLMQLSGNLIDSTPELRNSETNAVVELTDVVRDNYAYFGFSSLSSVNTWLNNLDNTLYLKPQIDYNNNEVKWILSTDSNNKPGTWPEGVSLAEIATTNNKPYVIRTAVPARTAPNTASALGRVPLNNDSVAGILQATATVSGGSGSGSFDIPAVTVEELRIRMQMQAFLERNEVGGSRYTEMLYAHWGVKDPDGRLQRSEFIGGCKQPIVINDISQTVNTDDDPLGAYGGQGTSSSVGKVIRYRVPEHGYIIGLTCIVPRSGYSQGIHPMWTRFDRLDYFWPSFAHLGEQEVKYKELMFTGINPDQTFGYQQRYAEYKCSNDEVHGDMKGGLAHWHMSRIFDTPTSSDDMPKLSEYFTTPQDSDSDALSRVWPVANGAFEVLNADHFVLDIYQHFYASRRMPKYATPRNGS